MPRSTAGFLNRGYRPPWKPRSGSLGATSRGN